MTDLKDERIKQLEWSLEKTLSTRSANNLDKNFDIKELSKEFPPEDIEWRVERCGLKSDGKSPWAIIVPYIDARAVMNRLDETVGTEFWQDGYSFETKGVVCSILLKLNGEWISKQDGAAFTDNDKIDEVKTAISNSFRRTAVKWGIGRYLYEFDTTYAEIVKEGAGHYAMGTDKKTNTKFTFYWKAPISTKPPMQNTKVSF